MDKSAAQQLVSDLYEHALGRNPSDNEYADWVGRATSGMPPEDLVRRFYRSTEFVARKERRQVEAAFPPGHFYSPVVDPGTVQNYLRRERQLEPGDLPGLTLDLKMMRNIWLTNLEYIKSTPFTDQPSAQNRYSYLAGFYPPGDAIILRMMISHLRPKRVIEIGSGISSACILDSAEHAVLTDFTVTCIEPYPNRLKANLRPKDNEVLSIVEKPVQEVPQEKFDELERNDILFIDSTHVMKTGSDVHYELFHVLPRLKPGVIVHFHDIFFPFEYPDDWLFGRNLSWNEAYALRAFLMYNKEFSVLFWNPLFADKFRELVRCEYPDLLRNTGGAIWIERTNGLLQPEVRG